MHMSSVQHGRSYAWRSSDKARGTGGVGDVNSYSSPSCSSRLCGRREEREHARKNTRPLKAWRRHKREFSEIPAPLG